MTCIAYKNGKMTADRKLIRFAIAAPVTKIRRVEFEGKVALCGYSGRLSELDRFCEWVRTGLVPENWPFKASEGRDDNDTGLGLVVIKEGESEERILFFDNTPYPIYIERDYHAIGSDGMPAICLMQHGASAAEAIEIISCHSILTGGGSDTIQF